MVKETKVEKKLRGNEKRYDFLVFRLFVVWPISALVSVSSSATVISALVSVSSSATVEPVVGKDCWNGLIPSREIPKNGSGNRNWGNPKDVNEQL